MEEATKEPLFNPDGIKVKKWDHLAIRPETFKEFQLLQSQYEFSGADAFIKQMIVIFRMRQAFLARKKEELK